MARVTAVDENDEFLCYKEETEMKAGEYCRCSALWITDPDGNILLQRRSMRKSNPGKWSAAAAGHVDEGETYEESIIRETYEELGIRVQPHALRKFLMKEPHALISQWFTTIISSDTAFRIDHSEVAEVRWWTREELARAIAEHPEEFMPSAPKWFDYL